MTDVADEPRVTIEQDVVFGTGGGRDLRCDIYRPHRSVLAAQEFTPAVVLTHGGGWRSGDRTQLKGYGLRLAKQGYVCVAHEYRLTPEARWPNHVEDVKCAIRWTRANAERLGIDAHRIAIQGNSAGGHLALVAAGTPDTPELEGDGGNGDISSAVAACVAIYPFTSMRYSENPRSPLRAITDQPSEWVATTANPMGYVKVDFPPTLLIHGDADAVIPVQASLDMHRALLDAGATVELHVYSRKPHAFDASSKYARPVATEVAFFLDRYVGALAKRPLVQADPA